MWLPPLRFVAWVVVGFAAGALAGAVVGLAGAPPAARPTEAVARPVETGKAVTP